MDLHRVGPFLGGRGDGLELARPRVVADRQPQAQRPQVSLQRNALYPDVPTIAESGIAGFQALSWSGLSLPKGTPQAIVDKLEATMKKIMTSAAIKERMESVGFVIPEQGSAAYTRFVRSELELWTRVISTAGIKAN